MNVYTYIDFIPELHDDGLLELWAESWAKHGWNPVLLDKDNAKASPDFEVFTKAIEALPTVNIQKYELACYYRWLAMSLSEGGVMSDFDVINYGFTPQQVKLSDTCILYERRMPSVVSGSDWAFKKVCDLIRLFQPAQHSTYKNRPHCSDMLIVQAHEDKFLLDEECVEYTDVDWEHAKLVHFATSKLKRPKTKRIMEIRKP